MTHSRELHALGIGLTAIVLAGCAGSHASIAPLVPDASSATRARHASASWIQRGSSSHDLLYVSDEYANVYVYTYPQGKRVGKLTGFIAPVGECVDAAGDVFIVSAASKSYQSSVIYEYAHGGANPVAALQDSGAGVGCSIDPTTGNLAVANASDESNPYGAEYGSVAAYTQAQGDPRMYYSSGFHFDLCGYDDQGNLYLDSPDPNGNEEDLVRLSSGSSSFEQINLDTKFYGFPSSVQWDGRSMTVTSDPTRHGPLLVYRLSLSGSNGKVVGTTQLSSKKNNYVGQTWIQDKTFLAINLYDGARRTQVSLWKYPKGGEPQHNIRLSGGFKWGLTVSPAETRTE
jgi:hypothetical protein